MSVKKDLGHISAHTRRLRENVRALLENYGEILKAAKVSLRCSGNHNSRFLLDRLRFFGNIIQVSEEEQQRASEVQVAHVENEIEVRAANIVRKIINSRFSSRGSLAAGPRGGESGEAGVGSERAADPQRLLDSERFLHAAHLGAGGGPGPEQGGAGDPVQSGGRSGRWSGGTDCELCSCPTSAEPGAAAALTAASENIIVSSHE